MCKKYELLESIYKKYEEHIEMQGTNSPALIIRILTSLLHDEKEKNKYYERLLKNKAVSYTHLRAHET